MDSHDFNMIHDVMNAVKRCELEDYIKNLDTTKFLSFSPELRLITDTMENKLHSGSSFSYSIRYCQYYISHPQDWDELCKNNLPETK